MKVINLTTGLLCDCYSLVNCLYNITDKSFNKGYCEHNDPRLVSVWYKENNGDCYKYPLILSDMDKENLVFSKSIGMYLIKWQWDDFTLDRHRYINGIGRDMDFPYNFRRNYEAAESFDIFANRQKILDTKYYNISKYLKYSFGLEFETSQGFVPEDMCFRDGLIPLRDGSIGGLEYSTVVMQGNEGINLLKQQIDTLKEYTYFDKECSLHIHFGGYPINSKAIFIFYTLATYLESEIASFIPRYSFKTALYKRTGKDYCNKLPRFTSFSDLYEHIAETEYAGDLYQPHPKDEERNHKWDCHTR